MARMAAEAQLGNSSEATDIYALKSLPLAIKIAKTNLVTESQLCSVRFLHNHLLRKMTAIAFQFFGPIYSQLHNDRRTHLQTCGHFSLTQNSNYVWHPLAKSIPVIKNLPRFSVCANAMNSDSTGSSLVSRILSINSDLCSSLSIAPK